eukprot:scaffold257343_cov15-Tisochrysis_lutea.AAC.1
MMPGFRQATQAFVTVCLLALLAGALDRGSTKRFWNTESSSSKRSRCTCHASEPVNSDRWARLRTQDKAVATAVV